MIARLPGRFRASDDRGSMAMFLTIAVVGLAIAALLVPMVVTSSRTTRSDTSRVHALDAAQAGVNVMVGEIRAAKDMQGVGDSRRLPCESRSGIVTDSVVGPAAYTVSVEYFTANPVNATNTRPQPMRCVPRSGPYEPLSGTSTPKFARITSTGTDGPASTGSTPGRTLATTYVFRTANTNIVGGRIRINPATGTSPELCLDGGSATPIAGAVVNLQPCANPPQSQQVFVYRTDLTIQLLSSVTGTYRDGLCLDTAPPATAGRTVFLGACSPLGSPPYTQQWSYNDNGGYTASLPTSAATGTLSSQCFNVTSQSAGVQLLLASCSGGATTQSWIPDPAVGAGAAKAPQLVNFAQFGRCLDVTNQDPSSDHLIDYPCKQNPFPGAVAWNQKFTTPGIAAGASSAVGPITTTRSGITYCLTSPVTDQGYVTVSVCAASNPRQSWTVYNDSPSLAYSAKYTIVDNGSRCLGLTSPKGTEVWSAIDVEGCTGATEQKWNATADLASSVLQDVAELRP
ncbi:MAG: RICIN domain-containing protein [Nocardioides sp.]|nr:RICIN domain-containing protein [Nocardioides sp.]